MSAELAPLDVADPSPVVRDIRAVNDPPGVQNPYWEAVRQLPPSRIGSMFGDGWSPDGFGLARDPATDRLVLSGLPSRDELVHRFSWAITDPLSVGFVASHAVGGLVEIGAGSGYWAWQLAQRGIDVAAFDEAPPNIAANVWCQDANAPEIVRLRPLFHPVAEGTTATVRDFPDRTLFLCWPPYGSPMATVALDFYKGNRLIYVGEGEGGCCADDDFFTALGKNWVEVADRRPVQWDGIHDWITVYERAGAR